MNYVDIKSGDVSIITKKEDIIMDDNEQYEESNCIEMQSDNKSMNTKKEDIIMDNNNIHNDSVKLEITRSNILNELHKK